MFRATLFPRARGPLRLPSQAQGAQRHLTLSVPRPNAASTADKAANAVDKAASQASSAAKEAAGAAKDAAGAAKDAATNATSAADKAAGVAKSGVESVQGAAKKLADLASPVAQRAEKITGLNFGALSESISYNARVAGQVFKKVYIAEGLAPPKSFSAIQEAYKEAWTKGSDPSFWSKAVSSGAWKKIGIYAVEAYGIFTIGEMIGRRHIVGYKLDTTGHPDPHHH